MGEGGVREPKQKWRSENMWKYNNLSFIMWVMGTEFTPSMGTEFTPVLHGDWIHVLELGSGCLYPLSHLTCPISRFKSRGSDAESTDKLEVESVETKAAKDRPLSAFPRLAVTAISTRALLQPLPTQDFCGSLVKLSKFLRKEKKKKLCPMGSLITAPFGWLPVVMT